MTSISSSLCWHRHRTTKPSCSVWTVAHFSLNMFHYMKFGLFRSRVSVFRAMICTVTHFHMKLLFGEVLVTSPAASGFRMATVLCSFLQKLLHLLLTEVTFIRAEAVSWVANVLFGNNCWSGLYSDWCGWSLFCGGGGLWLGLGQFKLRGFGAAAAQFERLIFSLGWLWFGFGDMWVFWVLQLNLEALWFGLLVWFEAVVAWFGGCGLVWRYYGSALKACGSFGRLQLNLKQLWLVWFWEAASG